MTQFALSHNALAQWKKVITSSSFEPLLHPEVIALSKYELLSLLKVIALRKLYRRQRITLFSFSSNVADPCWWPGDKNVRELLTQPTELGTEERSTGQVK